MRLHHCRFGTRIASTLILIVLLALLSSALVVPSAYQTSTVLDPLVPAGVHAQNSFPPESACLKPLLRYWNEGAQKHFYTSDRDELGTGRDGWRYEGSVGYVAATAQCYAPNAVPFYRYWSSVRQKHFYTTDVTDPILSQTDYQFVREGTTGYILADQTAQYQTTALYRLFNADTDNHFYTSSVAERDFAVGLGYRDEGTEGYVFTSLEPTPTPTATPTAMPIVTSTLAVNIETGAPGSVFIFTAPNLPASARVQVAVQRPGSSVFSPLLTLTVPDDGTLVFVLLTTSTDPTGSYTIRIRTEPGQRGLAQAIERTRSFTLAAAEPLRTERPTDPAVPELSLVQRVYLPLIVRGQ